MKPKGSYKCKICDKKFNFWSNLHDHEKVHLGIRPYECDKCDKTFIRSQELKLHKNYHLGIRPFKCTHCPKDFSQHAHLRAHLRTHTGDKPFKCDLCPKRFTQSSHLRVHQTHHSGEKPYKCQECGDAFRLPSTLKCHMRRHTGEKPYKCHVCGMAFSQTTPLYHHLQKHTGQLPYKCRYCGRGFGIRKSCQDHENTVCVSGGRRRHKCVFCEERCYTKELFERHIRQHIGETPYFCRFCDLCFIDDKARRYHMRIHVDVEAPVKDKPFKCKLCHHSFTEEERYKRHLNQNHLEKKTEDIGVPEGRKVGRGRFKCEHCVEAFDEKEDLKDHKLNVHLIRKRIDLIPNGGGSSIFGSSFEQIIRDGLASPKKTGNISLKRKRTPYNCMLCEYSFEAVGSLALHMRIVHDGLEPKKCLFCWKSFPTKTRLRVHLKEEHRKRKCDMGIKSEDIKMEVGEETGSPSGVKMEIKREEGEGSKTDLVQVKVEVEERGGDGNEDELEPVVDSVLKLEVIPRGENGPSLMRDSAQVEVNGCGSEVEVNVKNGSIEDTHEVTPLPSEEGSIDVLVIGRNEGEDDDSVLKVEVIPREEEGLPLKKDSVHVKDGSQSEVETKGKLDSKGDTPEETPNVEGSIDVVVSGRNEGEDESCQEYEKSNESEIHNFPVGLYRCDTRFLLT